ncbi:MAG: heavy metal sensor histidine kinase [Candidatus Acidiferrales bacterium]
MLDTLRARLTFWYSIILAIFLLLFGLTSYLLFSRAADRRTDADLTELSNSFLVTFQDEIKDSDNPAGMQSAAQLSMIEHRVRDSAFFIVDSDGKVAFSSRDVPPASASEDSMVARAVASGGFHEFLSTSAQSAHSIATIKDDDGSFRAYAQRFTAEGHTWSLVILQSLHPQQELLAQIRLAFAWLIPLSVLLAGIGGYFLARKSLAPVAAMGAQAERISAANLHERLAVKNPSDELGRLARTFNDLLDRLDQTFERQRRFISDASHELRTPISILRGEAEVALSQPERSSEEYRESLAVLQQEALRLANIVEDLFTLTRADAGEYRLTCSDFYLDELAADCVRATRALAQAKNIVLAAEAPREMPVRADEELLRRMILNLLDNAIKYTPEGGNVSVACSVAPDGYELSVTDTGAGIPADMQSRIFERFFRVDPARSRSGRDGGAGLGLSIARWIAEAHQGRIDLVRSGAAGSVFKVYIPAAHKN